MYDKNTKLNALIRLIGYVKYESKEYESLLFAGSPIIGEIYKKLLVEFNSSINKELSFNLDINSSKGKKIYKVAERNLQKTENWHKLDEKTKFGLLKDFVFPYYFSEDIVENLITQRNKIYNG